MNKYISIVLSPITLFSGLSSCTSENDPSDISLTYPEHIRAIQSIDHTDLHVDIQVNDGPVQTFDIRAASPQIPIAVTGVIANAENRIVITWYEYFEGTRLDLSEQIQEFVADATTEIDAAHNFLQFDFDGDGVSNFDERFAGTCVWGIGETCANPVNLLMNGNFNNADQYWWRVFDSLSTHNIGEFCARSPVSAINDFDAQFGHLPAFTIEANSVYRIRFDARAAMDSTMRVVLTETQGSLPIYEEEVEVSSIDETKTLIFNNSAGQWDPVILNVLLGNGMENNYCVDNFSLVKLSD